MDSRQIGHSPNNNFQQISSKYTQPMASQGMIHPNPNQNMCSMPPYGLQMAQLPMAHGYPKNPPNFQYQQQFYQQQQYWQNNNQKQLGIQPQNFQQMGSYQTPPMQPNAHTNLNINLPNQQGFFFNDFLNENVGNSHNKSNKKMATNSLFTSTPEKNTPVSVKTSSQILSANLNGEKEVTDPVEV